MKPLRSTTRGWRPRPRAGTALRVALLVAPAALSLGVVVVVTHLVPRPADLGGRIAWFALVLAVATIVLVGAQRAGRRVTPLSMLLSMSLTLPDRIPSRFAVALRAANPRRAASGRAPDSENSRDPLAVVLALAAALHAHDRRTRGHSDRVRALALLIGEELRLGPEEQERLGWAALLHDIGKLEVPASILNSKRHLTDAQRETIDAHPGAGEELAGELRPWMGDWVLGISEHHERYDGGGYPNGLAGTEISLAGRIISVADSYETMTAVRSYKKAMSPAAARSELVACAGTHFDPQVVHAFLRVSVSRMRWRNGAVAASAELPIVGRLGGLLAQAGAGAAGLVATGGLAAFIGVAAFTGTPSILSASPTTHGTVQATLPPTTLSAATTSPTVPVSPSMPTQSMPAPPVTIPSLVNVTPVVGVGPQIAQSLQTALQHILAITHH